MFKSFKRQRIIRHTKMKYVRFYKECNRWYANIPQHSKDENEMIDGSDEFLDALCKIFHKDSELIINVADGPVLSGSKIRLTLIEHDEEGATYEIHGKISECLFLSGWRCWLCNVVHTLFGEHPKEINIMRII